MNITIKESMILRKCLNDYVLENNLEYDKSPLFNDLIHKLKEYERPKFESSAFKMNDLNLTIQRNNIKCQRKALNKELKKYSYQTITNKKILELIKDERVESINNKKELVK